MEITGSNVGYAPMLPERLDQIPADLELGSVTADGTCDTRKCHDAVAELEVATCCFEFRMRITREQTFWI